MLFNLITLSRRCVIRRFNKKFKGVVKKEEKFKVNESIFAHEIRVIGDTGDMLGVMSVQDGLRAARDKGLDLVEIAPSAKPPTCKIMDYGKWRFDTKKKEKTARKKQVKIVIKEIQARPRTDLADLNVKIRKAREFLLSGYKVKFHLRFSGRELAHKDLGLDVIDRFAQQVNDLAVDGVEKSKMERRSVFAMFTPDPVKLKEYRKKHAPKKASPSKTPADQTVSSKTASAPKAAAKAPLKKASAPKAAAKAPSEKASAPKAAAKAPSEKASAPKAAAKAPLKKAQLP